MSIVREVRTFLYYITCIFLFSGEHREEVIAVDINGFRVMSNTSFREHFRMDRTVFQVLISCFNCSVGLVNGTVNCIDLT